MQPDSLKNHHLPVDFNRQYHALAGLDTREFLSWVYSPHKPFGDVGVVTSFGTESAVMLHLARKAFYPSIPPFPLLHVDTRWKFRAMYEFREKMAEESGMELLVHINPEGVKKNINPFDHGSALHTDIMKTEGLKQALDEHRFDVAFGGARRDEEKSRAKERIFSFRNQAHRWDPKNQRPELWNVYNCQKNQGGAP